MASTQTRPNRLVAELLQEEQEPFTLEAYLSERGYVESRSKSQESASWRSVPYSSSKVLKSVYKKLLLIHKRLRIKSCDGQVEVGTRNSKQVMDSQDPTSMPSVPRKDSKKHRSVPRILEGKKVTEETILSASLCELLVSSTTDKFQVARSKDKRMLQQNKQLLFDCVREIIENQRGEVLGSEEIGKLICQKIKEWGKLGTSINQLLNLDFQQSIQELNDFKVELAVAIGDGIMEELGKELVTDILWSHRQF